MQRIGRTIGLALVVAALASGPARAEDRTPTLFDCLSKMGEDDGFGRCMAEGPAIARLLRDTRRDLAEARAMAGEDDRRSAGYRLRAVETRLIRATADLFPDEDRRLPDTLTALVNEVAVTVAQRGGVAPSQALARHWTADTRAEIALATAPTQVAAVPTPPSPATEDGRGFAEILAATADAASPQPVSGAQYAAVGLFQVAASTHLDQRNLGGIVTVQNRIADYRSQLQDVNEAVSPDLDQLDRDLIEFILRHDGSGNA